VALKDVVAPRLEATATRLSKRSVFIEVALRVDLILPGDERRIDGIGRVVQPTARQGHACIGGTGRVAVRIASRPTVASHASVERLAWAAAAAEHSHHADAGGLHPSPPPRLPAGGEEEKVRIVRRLVLHKPTYRRRLSERPR
jgi:hypothetical protein